MLEVILQAGALILMGVIWRLFSPQGLTADTLRQNLTGLVYVLLLPALVLVVLWRAPLDLDAARVSLLAAFSVLSSMLIASLALKALPMQKARAGAMLLAAAFPNATYMGLPVLEATLGPWARSVAIQYDLFACTPLLLSLGVFLAAHYGGTKENKHPLKALLTVPPLWAALVGVTLNQLHAPLPSPVGGLLDMMAAGVVPLMLFSLGLGLRWQGGWAHHLPPVIPVILIQLLIAPLLVWLVSGPVGVNGALRVAVVLEAGMPSMVLGVVLCDRYRLDTTLYAMAVTLTTALSILTLPFWYETVSV